jgi:DNA invertase Pin-like site-specific DNA recombinase
VLIGYARVSTRLQETYLQIDALKKAGAARIYEEKASSVGARPQLEVAIASLRPGDVLLVYRIDRFARSLGDLISVLDRCNAAGAAMRSLNEPLDTSSPMGVFMLQVLGAVAQLERNIIRERSIAGQVAALRRGAIIGRPRRLTAEQDQAVYARWMAGETKADLMRFYNCSNTTIDLAIAYFEPHRRKKRPLRPILGPLLQAELPGV